MRSIFTLFVLVLLLSSCKKDVAKFSCDPILNEYVSTHQKILKSISLSELASSDLVFQQAVFRSFDAAKKREVWLQRLQTLLETQNYSEDEYAHVKSLQNHIHENYFVKENVEAEAAERAQFAQDWKARARNVLGWSEKQIAFVVYRFYTSQARFEAELAPLNSIQEPTTADSGDIPNCNCNTLTDFCKNASCIAGGCTISSSGCGWLWSETCNGLCA